jgi:hypothetical protein
MAKMPSKPRYQKLNPGTPRARRYFSFANKKD